MSKEFEPDSKAANAQHIEHVNNDFSGEIYIDEKDAKREHSPIYQACLDLDEQTVQRIAPNGNVDYMFQKIDEMDEYEALDIISKAIKFHDDDWNFPPEMMEKMKTLVKGVESYGGDKLAYSLDLKIEACLLKWASPYPEVRSILNLEADEDDIFETPRAYFLGVVWSVIGAGVNTFFFSRFPGISISGAVVQMLVYPCGKFLALTLPDWGISVFGHRWSLNPGPYNFREQMFVTIIFSAGMSSFQAYQMIIVQKMDIYYGHKWVSFGYQILLTLFFQFMGIGLAGIFRRIAVYPVKALWPGSLFTVAMNRALLSKEPIENINGWTISRYKFFWVTVGSMFLYYWLPGYLFTALSTFNWMTWIAPNNVNLAAITGSASGMGINPLPTFDWNVMTAAFPSLTNPFFNIFHRFLGTIIGAFIIIGLWYTNYRWAGYLPINSSNLFDNTGGSYNVSKMIASETSTLDEAKYQTYSPPFLSAGKQVQAGASFVVYPLYFIYMMYNQWPMIRDGFVDLYKSLRYRKASYEGLEDPFSRYQARYKEAPDWWFIVIFLITIVIAIVTVEVYPVDTPVWFLFVIIGLSLAFMAPLLILQAVTGTNFGLLYLMIIVAGYCLPGNANAQMMASLLGGWSIDGTTDSYVSLQKLGHYSGLAPRAIFRGQMLSTLATAFVAVGVEDWQMANIKGLCSPTQPDKFTCAAGAVATYSSSVVYGLIGPKRVFAGLYPIFKWCFLIGFLMGVVYCGLHWLGRRYGARYREYCARTYSETQFKWMNRFLFVPAHYLAWFNPVLVLVGMQDLCPVSICQCWPGFVLNFIFNYWIQKRYTAWWEKYNYVLAAALYAGVAFSAIIIYFAVQFHPKPLVWWGNTVSGKGVDGQGIKGWVSMPDRGYFGPEKGNFA